MPVPLLPTAMTFSRHWMYSQRASSITSALFTEGMAGKSKVSKALDGREPGRPDPPVHHALVAVDEFQFRQPEQVPWEWSTPSAAHWAAIFPYSLRKLGSFSSFR